MRSHVAGALDRLDLVSGEVDDERRSFDLGKHVAHVGLVRHLGDGERGAGAEGVSNHPSVRSDERLVAGFPREGPGGAVPEELEGAEAGLDLLEPLLLLIVGPAPWASGARWPHGFDATMMSAAVLAGYVAANSRQCAALSLMPIRIARSIPTASMTVRTSSMLVSRGPKSSSRAKRSWPRRH